MSAAESTLTEALEAQAASSKKKIPEEAKAVMVQGRASAEPRPVAAISAEFWAIIDT